MSSYATIQLLIPFYILIYTWAKPPERVFQLTFLIRKGTRRVSTHIPDMEALCSKHSSHGHMASSSRLRLLVIQKYFQMSKNDSPEVLGMPGKAHKSPKDLADDSWTSLVFSLFLYYYV